MPNIIPVLGKQVILPLDEEPTSMLIFPEVPYDYNAEHVTCWNWNFLHFGLSAEYCKDYPDLPLQELHMLLNGYIKTYGLEEAEFDIVAHWKTAYDMQRIIKAKPQQTTNKESTNDYLN